MATGNSGNGSKDNKTVVTRVKVGDSIGFAVPQNKNQDQFRKSTDVVNSMPAPKNPDRKGDTKKKD